MSLDSETWNDQLKPQPLLWFPGYTARIRNERGGRDDFSACLLWISEGRTGLDRQVGEGVNTKVFPWQPNLCKASVFTIDL